MSGLSRPVTPIAPVPGDGYVAGACNIGPWEIRRRRMAAIGAFAVAVAMLAGLVVVGAPAWTRLLLLLPLAGGMVSWLQARRRFCVAYAMAGVSNFTDTLDGRRVVTDAAQRDADRRAMAVLLRDAVLLAVVPTLVAVLLPV